MRARFKTRQGRVVAGATVIATNEETNVSYNTVSSDAGEYRFARCSWTHTITVEQANFKRYSTTKMSLTANDMVTIDILPEIGNVSRGRGAEVTGTYEQAQTSQSFGTIVMKGP